MTIVVALFVLIETLVSCANRNDASLDSLHYQESCTLCHLETLDLQEVYASRCHTLSHALIYALPRSLHYCPTYSSMCFVLSGTLC